jgi:hypothetical protein
MRFILILLFTYSIASAQTDVDVSVLVEEDSTTKHSRQLHDSVRAKFVRTYPGHFFVWPVIKKRSLSVEARSYNQGAQRVTFTPNNSVSMGLGFYVFEVAFEVALSVPIDEQSKRIYGETTSADFQLNALGKYWGLDIYRQKYEGFYMGDSFNPVVKGNPFPQRADIVTRNFGLAGIYTLNRDRFSLRSSFNFAEQQLYSRGSWIVTGTLNSFRMDGDSAILSIPNRESFSQTADFVSLRYTTLGVAPGYSHNFIFKNFFLNLTLGIGPAHNWTYLKLENGDEKYNVSINSISVAKFGIGYNSDHFFAGIGFTNQSRNLKIEDFRVSNSTGFFKLMFGWRIEEVGILKKRAVDFIPFSF